VCQGDVAHGSGEHVLAGLPDLKSMRALPAHRERAIATVERDIGREDALLVGDFSSSVALDNRIMAATQSSRAWVTTAKGAGGATPRASGASRASAAAAV
jgi:hypothetical protein